MTRKHSRSFDLLSSFDNYWPDTGGLFILLGLLLAGACIGNLVNMLLVKLCGYDFVNSYGVLISYPIQFIPPMMFAASRSRRLFSWSEGLPLDRNRFKPVGGPLLALMTVVGTISASVLIEPVTALLPDMPEILKNALKMITEGPLWATVLSTCIFAPFFEEWLCRGMVLRGMLQQMKPSWAIVVSAAFFALIHLNPWQAIPAFILGCLFGLVYYKTGSLKLTMLMHCANNGFSVLLTRLPGTKDYDYIYQAIPDTLTYTVIMLCCLSLTVLMVTRLIKTDFTE